MSPPTKTTSIEGRRLAAGTLGRARLAHLLGLDKGKQHGVKAAAWVADHVEIAVPTGRDAEVVFILEARGEGEGTFVAAEHLALRYRGKELPTALSMWIQRTASERLKGLTIRQVMELLIDDPELGQARQPFPSTASPHPAHQLDTWGASDGWADFFARGEIARGQLDSIDPTKLFRFIQHCDSECLEVNPYGIVPLVLMVDYPWLNRARTVGMPPRSQFPALAEGESVSDFGMLTTDLDERDVIFGNPDKVRSILQTATSTHDPQGRILFFSNTCVPAVTGEDVESVVREFQRSSDTPLVYLTVTPKAMNDVFRDLLVTRRQRLEQQAPAPDARAINLIGFASDAASDELIALLAAFGVRVNLQLFPDLDMRLLERVPGGALNVFRPNQVWAHYYEQLREGSRIPHVAPTAPLGLQGTRRWMREVLEALGIGFDDATFERAAGAQLQAWRQALERAKGRRLGLIVRGGELHHLTDPAQTWGFPVLEFAREAGFGVDLLMQTNDLRAGRSLADELARSIRPGPSWTMHVFQSFESMQGLLDKSGCQAVMTHHFFDWRLSQAGKSRFSLQHFELGLGGGARTVERLVDACSIPFFQKYRRFLQRTREGLRLPPGRSS